jgi:hypothetical protein
MNPLTLKSNNTTRFILPMLYFKGLKYTNILNDYFTKAYIADIDHPENDGKLAVKYMTHDSIPKELGDNIYYDEYDSSFIAVIEIPDKYLDDYYKILAGQYSSLSEEYKKTILSFWEEDNTSTLYGVLYKVKNLVRKMLLAALDTIPEELSVRAEYWPTPKMYKEILGMEKF